MNLVRKSNKHPHRQTIKAIPHEVIQRLAVLTSREHSIADKTIDTIYPEHCQDQR